MLSRSSKKSRQEHDQAAMRQLLGQLIEDLARVGFVQPRHHAAVPA